jgi:hypothetical protein
VCSTLFCDSVGSATGLDILRRHEWRIWAPVWAQSGCGCSGGSREAHPDAVRPE